MTASEVSRLLLAMAAAWPSFQVDELRVKVWTDMTGDIKRETAMVALQVLMARSTFPPSIAQFREACWEVQTPEPERMDEGVAWGLVNQSIDSVLRAQQRDYSAFYGLPLKVLAVCQSIGFSEIVNGDLDVVRSNFLRIYQGNRRRERDLAVLPPAVREAVAQLGGGEERKGLPPGAPGIETQAVDQERLRELNERIRKIAAEMEVPA